MSKDDSAAGFKWWLIICAFLLLPALVALGCWQLQRAAQKEQMLKAWNDDRAVLHSLEQLTVDSPVFVVAQLTGRLLPHRWLLLDNRTRDGMAGYEVIAFMPSGSALLPVNLGWTAASPDRRLLPTIDLPAQARLEGRLHRLEAGLLLAEDIWDSGWPKRVQALDSGRLQQVLGQEIWPWVLDVTAPVVEGLRTDRHQAGMLPERHLAYAFQWFTMAAVLAGLLLWHWRRLRSQVMSLTEH